MMPSSSPAPTWMETSSRIWAPPISFRWPMACWRRSLERRDRGRHRGRRVERVDQDGTTLVPSSLSAAEHRLEPRGPRRGSASVLGALERLQPSRAATILSASVPLASRARTIICPATKPSLVKRSTVAPSFLEASWRAWYAALSADPSKKCERKLIFARLAEERVRRLDVEAGHDLRRVEDALLERRPHRCRRSARPGDEQQVRGCRP